MSTRGSFIIRKNNVDKELVIQYDAYPEGAGLDVIDLIKTIHLDYLYDCLTESDFDTGERTKFELDECKLVAKRKKTIIYSVLPSYYIQNSLFCEYAYVIDIDKQELHFYVGNQTSPQEGNVFGNKPFTAEEIKETYYPCHLKAVFPFACIRESSADSIIAAMEKWAKGAGTHLIIAQELEKDNKDYSEAIKHYVTRTRNLSEHLLSVAQKIADVRIVHKKRLLELSLSVGDVENAILSLQRETEVLGLQGMEK
jgi:hypothetical protein